MWTSFQGQAIAMVTSLLLIGNCGQINHLLGCPENGISRGKNSFLMRLNINDFYLDNLFFFYTKHQIITKNVFPFPLLAAFEKNTFDHTFNLWNPVFIFFLESSWVFLLLLNSFFGEKNNLIWSAGLPSFHGKINFFSWLCNPSGKVVPC